MRAPDRYARWRTDTSLHCAHAGEVPTILMMRMKFDAQVQRIADPSHVLNSPCTAQAIGHAPMPEADQWDSSIYDFSTYADGEEGVRLLKQNGFDEMKLSLIGKGQAGEWHPPGFPWNGDRIKSRNGQGSFWDRISDFVGAHLMSAPHTGPQILVMHGSRAEAAKAHGVLMEHTNEMIAECLRFR